MAMPKGDPWAIYTPAGLYWLGIADDEQHAWTIALGWPSPQEIRDAKEIDKMRAARVVVKETF